MSWWRHLWWTRAYFKGEKIITQHNVENKQLKKENEKLNVNENENENENENKNENENETENENENVQLKKQKIINMLMMLTSKS